LVAQAVAQYAEEIVGLDIPSWLKNPKNIALTNDNKDVVMFEDQAGSLGAVCGHYFLFSRGRKAIEACKEFLAELFTETDVKIVLGLTPENNKAALWMNRQLGFKEHGTIETEIGPCRFVILSKDTWKDMNK
jgi:hypothetical protein